MSKPDSAIRDTLLHAPAAAAGPAARRGPALELLDADKVERRAIDWLWPERFALGALSVVAGDPGLGKSQLTMDMAARVSTGSCWPDGTACPLGSVLAISAEDAPDTTIVPRLMAAGADCRKIKILARVNATAADGRPFGRMLSLAEDVPAMRAALDALGDARLVVIDPISAYLAGVETHRNADVRAVLAPLADLAAALNVAVVAVTHLNKGSGGKALYRLTGSLAFAAAARAVYVVAEQAAPAGEADGGAPRRRLFLQSKNNLGRWPNGSGHAFTIAASPGEAPRLAWESEPVSADLDAALGEGGAACENGGKLAEAVAWLRAALSAGPAPAVKLEEAAAEAGISSITLQRARKAAGAIKAKSGFKSAWTWSLPPNFINGAELHQAQTMMKFGADDELRQDGAAPPAPGYARITL